MQNVWTLQIYTCKQKQAPRPIWDTHTKTDRNSFIDKLCERPPHSRHTHTHTHIKIYPYNVANWFCTRLRVHHTMRHVMWCVQRDYMYGIASPVRLYAVCYGLLWWLALNPRHVQSPKHLCMHTHTSIARLCGYIYIYTSHAALICGWLRSRNKVCARVYV